jgi:hypothetical protein
MNIPNLLQEKFVNPDGSIHPLWFQWLTQLTTQMQTNLSNEGFVIPSQNTADTTTILTGDANNPPVGKMLYDAEAKALKVNIDGVIKTISVT